jgi:hypothetical protein
MQSYSFEAKMIRPEGVGTRTFVNIPPEVLGTFGSKGQVKVRGTVNGYPFRSTALPMGDGTHYLVVGKSIRDQIHAAQGDTVTITIELDSGDRQLETPADFTQALSDQPQANEVFDRLSYSHKKAYVDWISSAKQGETRQRRIEKALVLLSQGKKLRG